MTGIGEMFAELTGDHEYDARIAAWAAWRVESDRNRVLVVNAQTKERDRVARALYVERNRERVREWNRRNQAARRARLKAAS